MDAGQLLDMGAVHCLFEIEAGRLFEMVAG